MYTAVVHDKLNMNNIFTFFLLVVSYVTRVSGQSDGFCSFVMSKDCIREAAEEVCGTNDITYRNDCEIAKAFCLDKTIHIQYRRPCGMDVPTTTAQRTHVPTTTSHTTTAPRTHAPTTTSHTTLTQRTHTPLLHNGHNYVDHSSNHDGHVNHARTTSAPRTNAPLTAAHTTPAQATQTTRTHIQTTVARTTTSAPSTHTTMQNVTSTNNPINECVDAPGFPCVDMSKVGLCSDAAIAAKCIKTCTQDIPGFPCDDMMTFGMCSESNIIEKCPRTCGKCFLRSAAAFVG